MVECFLNKYAPKTFNDFSIDNYTILNNSEANILINGSFSSGKTTLLFKFIQNHFNDITNVYDNPNILFINNLKDQGIQFCRNNVKTFCQTASTTNKKKLLRLMMSMNLVMLVNKLLLIVSINMVTTLYV